MMGQLGVMGVLALWSGSAGLLPLGLLLLAGAGAWAWMERRGAAVRLPVRTIRLTGQHALHVLHVDGRRIVVGTGPGAAPRLIDAGPEPEPPPTDPGIDPDTHLGTDSGDAWTRS